MDTSTAARDRCAPRRWKNSTTGFERHGEEGHDRIQPITPRENQVTQRTSADEQRDSEHGAAVRRVGGEDALLAGHGLPAWRTFRTVTPTGLGTFGVA